MCISRLWRLQADNFIPTMTTEETMHFYAAMILPRRMGAAARRQRAMEVLEVLGLSTHRKTLVRAH
jgi:ABC-type multidrug transport system ATPase subunit